MNKCNRCGFPCEMKSLGAFSLHCATASGFLSSFSNFLFPELHELHIDSRIFVIFNEIFTFNIYWTFIAFVSEVHFTLPRLLSFSSRSFSRFVKTLKHDDAWSGLHILRAHYKNVKAERLFAKLDKFAVFFCCGRCSDLCNRAGPSSKSTQKSRDSCSKSANHTSNCRRKSKLVQSSSPKETKSPLIKKACYATLAGR